MAVLKPFRAWRPEPELAQKAACVPYDVINTDEARRLADGNPESFLHVIRPEIDLPEGTSVYDSAVYNKGRDNLKALLSSGSYLQEDKDALYIYLLTMGERSQAGVFGCVSTSDYENEVILKHELTRPAKEDDRTRHILTQQAHAEPVMLTFRDRGRVTELMNRHMENEEALYAFTAEDGVKHTIWKVEDTSEMEEVFSSLKHFYVADGHHRCASATRAAKEMAAQNPDHTGEEAYNFFPAVLFPMDQMEILAYNRIVFDIPEDFNEQLQNSFSISEGASPVPAAKGFISVYTGEDWTGIELPSSSSGDAASRLDVARLQEHILEPMLGIEDQRTDSNIDFVGGIRGTDELEQLVDNGEAALAISMYPTSIEELMDVSDAGQLMPPKSTWFEPKLRSGLIIHTF